MQRLSATLERGGTQTAIVIFVVLSVFATYILDVLPHCCEDINYLAYHSLEQRLDQFWNRTINEGRWFFALSTALVSGHVVTYVFAFIAVLASAATGILLAKLFACRGIGWLAAALLYALNPFLLVLYPWPVSFALFNLANLLAVASFVAYLRRPALLWAAPALVAVCVATYQPTLAFLIEIVFLHAVASILWSDDRSIIRIARPHVRFTMAVFLGFLIYTLVTKILLQAHGIEGAIRRYQMWQHNDPSSPSAVLAATTDAVRWFLNHGVSEGINPASSALVGPLSLRGPLLAVYKLALSLFCLGVIGSCIRSRSWTKLTVALMAAPVTVLITLLPLIASGSRMINRVLYPFGLLLPTLFCLAMSLWPSATIRRIASTLVAVLLLLHLGLTAQFSAGVSHQAAFAKRQHAAMLAALSQLPGFKPSSPVLFYPFRVSPSPAAGPGKRRDVDGRYWPLFNGTGNFRQLIQFEQGVELQMVYPAELRPDELDRIDEHIRSHRIPGWPQRGSVFRLDGVREALFVVYFPEPFTGQ